MCPATWVFVTFKCQVDNQPRSVITYLVASTRFERLKRPLVTYQRFGLLGGGQTHRHMPVTLVMGPRPQEMKGVHCPEVAP